MIEISKKEVELVAKILGGASAAALALTNAEHRRAAGETVRFFRAGSSIVVLGVPAQNASRGSGDAA